MVQLAPAATLVPQLLAKTNEDASAPVNAMLLMDKAEVPLLVSVTVCELLVEPMYTEPNERLVADSETVCESMPVPLKEMDCFAPVAFKALSVRTRLSLSAPEWAGLKSTGR